MIEIEEATMICKLLGDKTRLTIMKMLETSSYCVCEFVEMFQMTQPSISQHLRRLKDMNLVCEERRGQWIFYSLNKNSDYYPFVAQILQSLPSQKEKIKRISCR